MTRSSEAKREGKGGAEICLRLQKLLHERREKRDGRLVIAAHHQTTISISYPRFRLRLFSPLRLRFRLIVTVAIYDNDSRCRLHHLRYKALALSDNSAPRVSDFVFTRPSSMTRPAALKFCSLLILVARIRRSFLAMKDSLGSMSLTSVPTCSKS